MTDYRVDNLRRRKRAERREFIGEGLFIMLVFGSLWLAVWAFSSFTNEGFSCERFPITVENGDTLDGIVREFCAGEVTSALDQVVRVYGTTIYAGNTIYLPTSDKCTLTLNDAGEVYETCE